MWSVIFKYIFTQIFLCSCKSEAFAFVCLNYIVALDFIMCSWNWRGKKKHQSLKKGNAAVTSFPEFFPKQSYCWGNKKTIILWHEKMSFTILYRRHVSVDIDRRLLYFWSHLQGELGKNSLRMIQRFTSHSPPQVMRASSHTGEGIPEVWSKMESYRDAMLANSELQGRRRAQQKVWMWSLIQENVLRHFQNHTSVRDSLPYFEEQVTKGVISPGLAADLLLKNFSSSFSVSSSS